MSYILLEQKIKEGKSVPQEEQLNYILYNIKCRLLDIEPYPLSNEVTKPVFEAIMKGLVDAKDVLKT